MPEDGLYYYLTHYANWGNPRRYTDPEPQQFIWSVAAYCGAIRLWLAMRGATSAGQRIVFVISCAAASATFLRDTRMCMDALRQSPASIAIGFATIAVPVAAALASLRAAHAYLEVRKPIT